MSRLFAGTPLEQPATCEHCARPIGACACPRHRETGKVLAPGEQPLRVRRENRAGKIVTVVAGFAPRSARSDDLPAMLKGLKGRLATGGSCDSTTLEFQGDHREKLVEHFRALGYPAKAAGG